MPSENKLSLTVDGRSIVLDIEVDTRISDIDTDMRELPGILGWYGRVLAAARANAIIVDGNYRSWRAAIAQSAKAASLPEHKVKSAIEGSSDFAKHKQVIANAEEIVVRLEKAYDALKIKGEMLRSIGAAAREELRVTGIETRLPDPEMPYVGQEERAERKKEELAQKLGQRRTRTKTKVDEE